MEEPQELRKLAVRTGMLAGGMVQYLLNIPVDEMLVLAADIIEARKGDA